MSHSSTKSTNALTVGIAAIIVISLIVAAAVGFFAGNTLSTVQSPETITSYSTTTSIVITTIHSIQNFRTTLTNAVTTTATTTVTNTSEIQLLQQQISALVNSSSSERFQLNLLEQVANLNIQVYFVNETWTVQGNSNDSLTSQVNEHNGTLYFSFLNCPNVGSSAQLVNDQYQLHILLNSKGVGSQGYSLVPINSSSFSVSLENVGSQSVSCEGTLAYVYQS